MNVIDVDAARRRHPCGLAFGQSVSLRSALKHRLVGIDSLRMITFLPELPRAPRLMFGRTRRKKIKQPVTAFGLQLRKELPCGELLQVRHHAWEVVAMHNGVEVILQNHPRILA